MLAPFSLYCICVRLGTSPTRHPHPLHSVEGRCLASRFSSVLYTAHSGLLFSAFRLGWLPRWCFVSVVCRRLGSGDGATLITTLFFAACRCSFVFGWTTIGGTHMGGGKRGPLLYSRLAGSRVGFLLETNGYSFCDQHYLIIIIIGEDHIRDQRPPPPPPPAGRRRQPLMTDG